ncbi:MAG: sigma-54 dependent transcriptional regulator [Bacteroidales bacterium]|jgi:DNA-binding NtrC family response regulator|nr:sigma-54 dependent transcriptional regulator [Bacteroidales bacterium]
MRILIADDEAKIRKVMSLLLKDEGYEVRMVENGSAAIAAAEQFDPDLILLDQQMPDMTGIEVLEKIKSTRPDQVVIIVTAHGSISLAVNAIKGGAYDFIEKPFDNDKLLLTVQRAFEYKKLSGELHHLKKQIKEYSFGQIVGNSDKWRHVMSQVRKVAPTSATVLVLGESGVGKELVARAVHQLSPRSEKPFVAVNCGAIPLTLIESELFGYEKGAFTDAKKTHEGAFEQSNHGTLFLDEIGELPLDAQVKLLRVLEEREIKRIGANKPVTVDVRIIAATNRNLEERVRQGLFRLDLLYRLNIFTIQVPSLRERKEDIPRLVDHFILKYNKILGLSVESITKQAMEKLINYEWPGNVRDLENAVQSAMILAQQKIIDTDHLPMRVKGYPSTFETIIMDEGETNKIKDVNARIEKELIEETLKKYDYNRTLTADALNISRKTLFNKMKKYGL